MLKVFALIIVSLLICFEQVDSLADQTGLTKDELEAISAFAELGTSVTKAAALHNVEAVVEVIASLGKAVPFLVPISTIVSGIIGLFLHHSSELDEIKKKLIEMDSHLFAIENKIDSIAKEIVHVAEINYYREHAEKIYTLQDAYRRYVEMPTNITQDSLIDNCKRNGQLEYINYVNRELSEGAQPLLKLMKDEYDMTKFQTWSRLLVGTLSQAMFLHSVCIGLQYKNSPDLSKTLSNDINNFHTISDNMLKVTKDGITDIYNNFFNNMAKKEIHDYAQSHQSDKHEVFAKQVHDMLSAKYYWRHWFVASFDGHKEGSVAGEGMPWAYSWFNQLGRSIYISSTNNPENLQAKIEACAKKDHAEFSREVNHGHILNVIFGGLKACLASFNGLGVLNAGRDVQAVGQLVPNPFVTIELLTFGIRGTVAKHYYTVFGTAPELPH